MGGVPAAQAHAVQTGTAIGELRDLAGGRAPWLLSAALAVLVFLLRGSATRLRDRALDWAAVTLLGWFAGLRIVHGRALAKYRREILKSPDDVKPAFLGKAEPLEIAKVFVPLSVDGDDATIDALLALQRYPRSVVLGRRARESRSCSSRSSIPTLAARYSACLPIRSR
jgi:hypothetical protein